MAVAYAYSATIYDYFTHLLNVVTLYVQSLYMTLSLIYYSFYPSKKNLNYFHPRPIIYLTQYSGEYIFTLVAYL